MKQLEFDLGKAISNRDEKMRQVQKPEPNLVARSLYRTALMHIISARPGGVFTSEDVRRAVDGLVPEHEPRVLGPVLMWAARKGMILKTGRQRQCKLTQCNGRPITEWQVATPSQFFGDDK